MKKLLLFQTTEELDKLKQSFDLSDKTNILVALTAEADYVAEKNNLDYKTIEDFYSEPELIELGVKGFAKVRDSCIELDGYLSHALKNIPEIKTVSTHSDFYDFYQLYGALLHRAFTLTNAITKISPELIVYFSYPSFGRNIKEDIRNNFLMPRILPLIAKRLNIKTKILPTNKKSDYLDIHSLVKALKYRIITRLLKPHKNHLLINSLLKVRRKILFYKENKMIVGDVLSSDKITLIGHRDSPYEERHIIKKLIDSGAGNFLTLDQIMEIGENATTKEMHEAAHEKCSNAWNQIERSNIKELFQIAELDLYPLVRSYLKDYICSTIPERIAAARNLKIGLHRIKSGAIIMPYVPEWIACIAKQENIPTIAFQHGGGYGYIHYPLAEHLLSGTDYFFCYGTGVSDFYKMPTPYAQLSKDTPRPVSIPIGSPSLDILKQGEQILKSNIPEDGTNKTIVYVLNNLYGDARYFSYTHYPDIWLWRLQRLIIKTCTKHQNIRLIVKLYPQNDRIRKEHIYNPIRDWLKDISLPNCHIVENGGFVDLLPVGDIFVIDNYLGTTILQVMTTAKPIITFVDHRWVRYDSKALSLLRKRAIMAESVEQFLYEIDTFLQKPDWNLPQPVNNEFLMAYGTHLNDGRSIERAMNMISDLAMKGSIK